MTDRPDDAPLGPEVDWLLLRIITPLNMEATAELEALRVEHADLTAQVAALARSPIVLPPRVVPLVASVLACSQCARLTAEIAEERAGVLRERSLAFTAARQEQARRLRLEQALAKSRAELVRARAELVNLRRRKTPLPPVRRPGPHQYGGPPA